MKVKEIKTIEDLNAFIKEFINATNNSSNGINDGYHTFGDLYNFRKLYNAALFNEWATENTHEEEARKGHNAMMGDNQPFTPKYKVHKSIRHNDGELCFGGGWFIVVAVLPTGQISNHYKIEDWDLFKIPETEKALYPFDGHTPEDVLIRLKTLCNGK